MSCRDQCQAVVSHPPVNLHRGLHGMPVLSKLITIDLWLPETVRLNYKLETVLNILTTVNRLEKPFPLDKSKNTKNYRSDKIVWKNLTELYCKVMKFNQFLMSKAGVNGWQLREASRSTLSNPLNKKDPFPSNDNNNTIVEDFPTLMHAPIIK